MAGHSKWAQIKHKKAVTDSRRGKEFTKLARAIQIRAALLAGIQRGEERQSPEEHS